MNGKNALQYLDDFFGVVRRRAADDPRFAQELIAALGGEVVFDSEALAGVVDPVVLVQKRDATRFKAIFQEQKVADLKKILIANNLADTSEMAGLKKPALLELLYTSAKAAADART